MSAQRPDTLPVDDPKRPLIRRGVFGTLRASAVFFIFTATKEIKPVYTHAPWLSDPYDTVISFTMFFVPLVAACLLVQVSLCLRSEPLSTARVSAILRACHVAIAAIIVDLVSAWVAIALGANRSQWTVPATGIEVSLLVLATAITILVMVYLMRVPRLTSPAQLRGEDAPDWLGDAIAVAKRESRRLGPFRALALACADRSERILAQPVRRHPLVAAMIASAVFGATVFGWQGYREGYIASATLLSMSLGFCAMYAFLVSAGAYFRLVRSTRPSRGMQRRFVDASVAASTAAIVTLAFRNSLWWTIGSNSAAAGPSQFAALVGTAAILTFLAVASVETLLRSYARPAC